MRHQFHVQKAQVINEHIKGTDRINRVDTKSGFIKNRTTRDAIVIIRQIVGKLIIHTPVFMRLRSKVKMPVEEMEFILQKWKIHQRTLLSTTLFNMIMTEIINKVVTREIQNGSTRNYNCTMKTSI